MRKGVDAEQKPADEPEDPSLSIAQQPAAASTKVEQSPGGLASSKPLPDDLGQEAVEAAECVVCWAADANVLYLPCGHCCTCQGCAQSFQLDTLPACPMCRQTVASMVTMV